MVKVDFFILRNPSVIKLRQICKKEVNNTAMNNNTECHKDMPDKIISKFNTPNKTGRRSYFQQYWRRREVVHS